MSYSPTKITGTLLQLQLPLSPLLQTRRARFGLRLTAAKGKEGSGGAKQESKPRIPHQQEDRSVPGPKGGPAGTRHRRRDRTRKARARERAAETTKRQTPSSGDQTACLASREARRRPGGGGRAWPSGTGSAGEVGASGPQEAAAAMGSVASPRRREGNFANFSRCVFFFLFRLFPHGAGASRPKHGGPLAGPTSILRCGWWPYQIKGTRFQCVKECKQSGPSISIMNGKD